MLAIGIWSFLGWQFCFPKVKDRTPRIAWQNAGRCVEMRGFGVETYFRWSFSFVRRWMYRR